MFDDEILKRLIAELFAPIVPMERKCISVFFATDQMFLRNILEATSSVSVNILAYTIIDTIRLIYKNDGFSTEVKLKNELVLAA